jgi:cytochrome c oxidase subunit 2
MSNVRIRWPRVAQVALPALALLIAGCAPKGVTSQGREISDLYTITFIVGVAIFLLVEGLIVFAVLRYRRKPGDNSLPVQTHGNNLLEVVWTIIPTAIVAVLFVFSWNTLNSVDKVSATGDVHIRAVAQRFQWSFEYLSTDGQTVVLKELAPEMTVPAGVTVHLSLRSPDVIHAFYVPQFLFKRDVVPGRDNAFDFYVDPEYAGQTFHGQCAELCGTFHDRMEFSVVAKTPADYQTWLQQQIAAASATPPPSPSGGPSGGPSGSPAAQIELSAANLAFSTNALTAPANTPINLKFTNSDAGVPHNVLIHTGPNETDPILFDGEIFPGVDRKIYPIPPLQPGTYAFMCKVHPTMTGTLTVQ